MWTTIEQVKELTEREVPQSAIIVAQNIIEAYVGRDEITVTDPNDRLLLGKATAYQAAYMWEDGDSHGNGETVFTQMSVSSMGQMGQMISFRNDGVSPWVAPLSVLACQRLSWKRMRSVKVGSIFNKPPVERDWSTD